MSHIIGFAARGLFWMCILNILINAIAPAISADEDVLRFFHRVRFPATSPLHPVLQPSAGNASSWADERTPIPMPMAGLVVYPVSTLIGRTHSIVP